MRSTTAILATVLLNAVAIAAASPAALAQNATAPTQNAAPHAAPTYSKDIAPILQKNCQSCHRPGEAAPFSMLTFAETKPWATAMKLAVQQKQMPPWFADPKYGHFSNNRALSEADIRTIIAWANAGAPEGDPKDLPPAVNWTQGWSIPKPDLVFQLPEPYKVPESGTVEYKYVIVPTGFTEDKWV
jgi:mono/diheme cytochrome c family protein